MNSDSICSFIAGFKGGLDDRVIKGIRLVRTDEEERQPLSRSQSDPLDKVLDDLADRVASRLAGHSTTNGILTTSHNQHREDRLLTAAEAAKMLNVSLRWVYAHSKKLPFTRRLSRKVVRFSEEGLLRYRDSKKVLN